MAARCVSFLGMAAAHLLASGYIHIEKPLKQAEGTPAAISAPPAAPGLKILASVLHHAGPYSTKKCMKAQLDHLSASINDLGATMSYEFFPVVPFRNCSDGSSCMEEVPECFPTRSFNGFINRSFGLTSPRHMFGDWCARLKLLDELQTKKLDYDYFLILQDDVLIIPRFATHLMDLLLRSDNYWSLVAVDVVNVRSGKGRMHDRFPAFGAATNVTMPLYSISGTYQSYQGAHAWVLRAETVDSFREHFRSIPAGPADLVTKVQRPLHIGMWAYQPGAIFPHGRMSAKELERLPGQCGGSRSPPSGQPRPQASPNTTTPGKGTVREMILFGMYDSGTKMVGDLIRKNLELPNRLELCKNFTAWGYCGRIWKHTNPQRVNEFEELRKCPGQECANLRPLKEAVAVTVVRHPFSLIRSLQKYHYDMNCGPQLPSDLHHGCTYKTPTKKWMLDAQGGMPRIPKATCGRKNSVGKPCWPTLMDAWNSYVDGYGKLEGHFHKVVRLRYEDVVQFPEIAVNKVAQAVGLPKPQAVHAVSNALGRSQYNAMDRGRSLLKLGEPMYGSNFTCSEMKQVCSRVSKNLLYQHGYHGCQRYWPAYDELIRHSSTYMRSLDVAKNLMTLPDIDFCIPDGNLSESVLSDASRASGRGIKW